jgi:hypothetical protein
MENIFLDLRTLDVENMIFVKPLGFGKFSKNLGVYYKSPQPEVKDDETVENTEEKKPDNTRRQKIIIKTPKMLVPFAIKDFSGEDGRKSASVSLSFGNVPYLHNEDEIKKFYHAIRKIDETIESTIKANKKTWNLDPKMTFRKSIKTLSENYPYYMSGNLAYDKEVGELFNVYDEKAKACNLADITKRCVASFVLELTDVWFNDINCGASWTVLQIRKSKPYSTLRELFKTVCFLEDPDDKDDPVLKHLASLQPKPIATSPSYYNIGPPAPHPINYHRPRDETDWSRPIPSAPPPPPSNSSATSFTPSLNELLAAKDRLKKSSTNLKTQKISALIMSNYATQSVSDATKSKTEDDLEEPDTKSDVEIDLEEEKPQSEVATNTPELTDKTTNDPITKLKTVTVKKKIIKKKIVKPKKALSQKT